MRRHLHAFSMCLISCSAFLFSSTVSHSYSATFEDSLEKLKSAESNGEIDTSPLTEAWQGVSNIPISDLPIVLRAFDDATPIGTNWLSAAVDKFLQQAATKNQEVPETMLSDYLLDTSSGWRSRQMALELLRELHDDSAPAIIAKLKRDPSAALRFPAIEQLLSNAKQVSDPDEQASAYRGSLRSRPRRKARRRSRRCLTQTRTQGRPYPKVWLHHELAGNWPL